MPVFLPIFVSSPHFTIFESTGILQAIFCYYTGVFASKSVLIIEGLAEFSLLIKLSLLPPSSSNFVSTIFEIVNSRIGLTAFIFYNVHTLGISDSLINVLTKGYYSSHT